MPARAVPRATLQSPVDWRAEDESDQDEESLLGASRQSLGWRIVEAAVPAGMPNSVPPSVGWHRAGRRPREALNVVFLICSVLGSLLPVGCLDQVGGRWGLQTLEGGTAPELCPRRCHSGDSSVLGFRLDPSAAKPGRSPQLCPAAELRSCIILQHGSSGMEPGAGCTPTLPAAGRAGRGGAGPPGQGDSGPSHTRLFPSLWPWEAALRCRVPGILELAALRGAVVNFIGIFSGPGSGSLVSRSRRLPWEEFGSCSPGLEEPLPCTE